MNRFLTVVTASALLGLLIFLGCDTRSPSGTGASTTSVATVELQVPMPFQAPLGVQTVTITAIAKDADGQGVPGVALTFNLTPGYGSIASQDSITDDFGVLEAQYQVNLSESIVEQITVTVVNSNISDSGTLGITLLDAIIQSVSVDMSQPVAYIGNQAFISDTVITTVIDPENNGISGLYVNLSSAYGTIANIDTTDNSGQTRAIITFSNAEIPASQSAISTWIKATVGGKSDSTLVTVVRQQNMPTSLTLTAAPAYMLLAAGSLGVDTVKAVVTDINGNGVPGISVSMAVNPTGGVNVEPAAATNAAGETQALVKSYARAPGDTVFVTGTVSVTLATGDTTLQATSYVLFEALESQISSITVWAEPPTLTVSPGASASSQVFARVLDNTNTAIQNLQVSFSSSKGALTPPTLTDSAGVASLTFYSNGDTGQVTVTANAGTYTSSTTIQVNQSASSTGSIDLSCTDGWSMIYADGDITFANLQATLKNADNEPIVGDTIRFTASPSWTKVASPRVTDSTGTANSTFDDLGPAFYTFPDSAMIIAKYEPLGIADTLMMMIMPAPDIDHIVISSPGESGMEASGIDTTGITARVYLEDGSFAPQGTPISFSTTLGQCVPNDTTLGNNGQVIIKFVSAQVLDTAFVKATSGGVESNEIIIVFQPGDPTDIALTSINPSQLVVGGPSGTMQVTVKDTSGNGVPSQQVTWTTSLGTVTSMSITDNSGIATAYLSPQTQAGVAQISVSCLGVADTLRFGYPILSTYPSSIQISSNVNSIQVQGTGGQEAAALSASVFDPNGNPVPDSILVAFELLAPIPGGAHFDNGLPMDSAFTSNGVAMVSLNSGTVSGPLKVQATTWMDWPSMNNPISATKSNIVIASGPAVAIDIDSEADAQPGLADPSATLKVGVSARVQDAYGNNVSAGTAVFFSVDPETVSIWQGPYGNIIGASSVVDTSGVATTYLFYNSEATFKSVEVIAQCTSAGSVLITDSKIVNLPIYGGTLDLNLLPNSWYFGSTAVIKVEATLKDDLLMPIDNGRIVFSNSMGLFFCADSSVAGAALTNGWFTTLNQNDIWRFEMYTGPNPIDGINNFVPGFHQNQGQAILFMRAQEYASTGITPEYPAVFTDPITPQEICEVSVDLAGSEVSSDPENVTFRRTP